MSGTLEAAVPSCAHEQRQDGPEAAIDELQREDDRHQQDEVLEREDVAEGDAALAIRGQLVVHGALVVHPEHEHERAGVEGSRDEKCSPQADDLRYGATDDRTERGSEPLGRLDDPDCRGHAVARRGIGCHRQRQRAVSGEEALQRAQGEDVPRPAHDTPSRPSR